MADGWACGPEDSNSVIMQAIHPLPASTKKKAMIMGSVSILTLP